MFLLPTLFYPAFLFCLMSSIMFMLSSNNWFLIWVMMEMNLLMFIPLMMSYSFNNETEGAIKYFLLQALTSAFTLILFLMNFYLFSEDLSNYYNNMFMFILLLKLGAAPCHLWFPQVMNSISWGNCLLLTTVQKIIPLSIFVLLLKSSNLYLLMLIIIMNSLIGGWGGFNQTQMRPLLAYSSIGHMSWMFAGNLISIPLASLYFIIYMIMNSSMFLNFYMAGQKSSANFNLFLFLKQPNMVNSYFNILSLAGLPPLLGFFPKWAILAKLFSPMPAMTIILIMGSLISLYYYLMIIINMMLSSMKLKTLMKSYSTPLLMMNFILSPIIIIYAMTLLY